MKGPAAAAALAAGALLAMTAFPPPAVALPAVALPATALPAAGPALGIAAQAGAQAARSPYWPAKAQSRRAARLLLEIPVAGPAGLGFSLGFHHAAPSNPAGGFLYRGHHGLEAAAHLLLRSALTANRARGGAAVGGAVSFDVYDRTDLLFFYPSLTAEAYLELPIAGPPRHSFALGLPCRLDFRRDLDLSAGLGLELSWRWYPRWAREGD